MIVRKSLSPKKQGGNTLKPRKGDRYRVVCDQAGRKYYVVGRAARKSANVRSVRVVTNHNNSKMDHMTRDFTEREKGL